MKEEHRCIYCNETKNLSLSHIFPDALTNRNITYYGVCKIKHNSEFATKFEDSIIQTFSFISNRLGIKTKSNKQTSFESSFSILGNDYSTKICDFNDIFNGRIITSDDNLQKFGTNEKLDKIPHKGDIMPCGDYIDASVKIELNTFISSQMNRLVAKIAYEWLCKKCKIYKKLELFNDVVSLIESGENNKINIQILEDDFLYRQLRLFSKYGDHCVISSFECNEIKMIVSFFGIVGYKIVLPYQKDIIGNFDNEVFFLRVSVNGEEKDAKYQRDNLKNENIFLYDFIGKTNESHNNEDNDGKWASTVAENIKNLLLSEDDSQEMSFDLK